MLKEIVVGVTLGTFVGAEAIVHPVEKKEVDPHTQTGNVQLVASSFVTSSFVTSGSLIIFKLVQD